VSSMVWCDLEAAKAASRAARAGPPERRRFFDEILVSLRVGDAAAPELMTWVSSFGCSRVSDALATWMSSFGPVGMVPSNSVGLFVLSMVMSVGGVEALPPVSTCTITLWVREEVASSAARRMCKRKVDMSSCGPTSMVIAEAPSFVVCVLAVCTDRCVGPGFGCMAAVVSPKMGDAAVLELMTWVSPSGSVGMTPCALVGLFVSPMVVLVRGTGVIYPVPIPSVSVATRMTGTSSSIDSGSSS